MTGVQTNQYARALDLALEFKAEGLQVMIGGFHVSGVMEMLPEITPELQEAIDMGITLVAGEVEQRWGELLEAAYDGRLEKAYNYIGDKPSLEGVPGPRLPDKNIELFFNHQTSFDAGRGCPFKCSFCTIINIQGNTMRGRNEDDIEKLVRHNYSKDHIDLLIRNVGDVTSHICKLKTKGKMLIRGPYGHGYPMDELKKNNVVVIAGGTGVAPPKSVIEYIKAHQKDYKDLHILLGFRNPDEILFKEDIESWKKEFKVIKNDF